MIRSSGENTGKEGEEKTRTVKKAINCVRKTWRKKRGKDGYRKREEGSTRKR